MGYVHEQDKPFLKRFPLGREQSRGHFWSKWRIAASTLVSQWEALNRRQSSASGSHRSQSVGEKESEIHNETRVRVPEVQVRRRRDHQTLVMGVQTQILRSHSCRLVPTSSKRITHVASTGTPSPFNEKSTAWALFTLNPSLS